MLSLVALCAMQTVTSRYTEAMLEALLTSTPDSFPSPSEEKEGAPAAIASLYPETRILADVHYIRVILRNLQECRPHARPSFYTQLAEHVRSLHAVLPDPLLAAFTLVLKQMASPDDADPPLQHAMMEVELLKVAEAIQVEVLRQTRHLTERASLLTLRFRHEMPFCG